MDMEKAFKQHLDEHKREYKERLTEEKKLYMELVNINLRLENMPLILKETFITRSELENGLCVNNFKNFIEEHEKEQRESGKCKENFERLMEEHKKEQMKDNNQLLTLLKNIGWLITTIVGSVSVISSGIVDNILK